MSRCTIDFIAASASSVVESIPMVLPFSKPPRQAFQHPPEHFLVGRLIEQSPRPRDGYVIRRALVQSDPEKLPRRERIRHAPLDPALAVNGFEKPIIISQKYCPGGSEGRPSLSENRLFAEFIEFLSLQHLVQTPVERMPGCFRQFIAVPQCFLPLALSARSDRHA